MALTPLFPAANNLDVPYKKSDGITNPDQTLPEPGCWFDDTIHDVLTGHYPQVSQITDYEVTGTFNSSATWTITVTPLTTQSGTAAAAHAQAAASATFEASGSTAAQVAAGLIAAINASTTTLAGAITGSNIASYVFAEAGASTSKVRLTARTPGATFEATVSSTTAGDSATATEIASPVTDTVKVGLYYAIDTSKGTNGRDKQGRPYLTKITSATDPANIVGPIFKGSDTQPVAQGFAYREYKAGQAIPLTRYGHVTAYSEAAVTLSSGPEPVYVRHTASGDYLAGMAADATRAAVGATANVWTGTPTVTNSVEYSVTIAFGDETVLLTYVSDGAAADTEIVAGLKVELAKYNTSVGQPLYGITASGTTTLILTGPDDGRGFTPATAATSPGVITWVESDAEVSTHHLLPRGDQFIAPSTRIGPAVVAVPVTPA